VTSSDADAAVRSILDVPIVFEVADGKPVHSAMVQATLGGVETRLILDTGSTDHVLTKALVDEVGLPAEPAEPGTDHAGAAVPSWSVGDARIEIGGVALDLHSVIAIEGPPPFVGWGVGGFLSPQSLHPTAWTVIDLASDRLVLLDASDPALDRWLADHHPSFRRLRVPRVKDASTPVIRTAIDPGDEVDTMLNTGGRSTEFSSAVVPADHASEVSRGGTGLSGVGVMGRRVGRRTLRVGGDHGAQIRIEDLVVRDGMEDPPAMVGSDVLRGTVVVVAADTSCDVRWLIPEVK
jgi:hypothetical protein